MWDFPKWILSQMSTSNISSCSTKKEVIPNFYSMYFLWFVHLTPMPWILQEMTLGKSLSNIDIHLDCSNSSLKSMLLSPGNAGISGLNLCLCTQLLLSCHFSTHTRALHPCHDRQVSGLPRLQKFTSIFISKRKIRRVVKTSYTQRFSACNFSDRESHISLLPGSKIY